MGKKKKDTMKWDFSGGPLVRELDPRATAKSLHATAKRSCVPLLRPGAANWIDKDKYFSKKYYGVNTIVMDKKSNF